MPVTIKPHAHPANPLPSYPNASTTAANLLRWSCYSEHAKLANSNILQSSFSQSTNTNITGSSNSFIDSVLLAYDQHHHLKIRPDEVWLAILIQFNGYINEHAEELRQYFVQHDGKKHLVLRGEEFTSKDGYDWGRFSYLMTRKISENLRDPTLREWILPAFSTTTKKDQAVAAIVMMSVLQKYFSYGADEICGIPTVTLLGEKSDWEEILKRIEKLKCFGEEPREWGEMLRPVLRRFVRSFEEPGSEEIKRFWQTIVHHDPSCCGREYTSGWINAFCYWTGEGKPFHSIRMLRNSLASKPRLLEQEPEYNNQHLEMDGVRYHVINLPEYPSAHVSVPVRLTGFSIKDARMVAGLVCMRTSSSNNPSLMPLEKATKDQVQKGFWKRFSKFSVHQKSQKDTTSEKKEYEFESGNGGDAVLDTLQPESGWWIFESKTDEEIKNSVSGFMDQEGNRYYP